MLSAEARIRQLEELYRVSKAARLPSLGGLAAADYETNDYYGEAHKGDAEFDVKATLSWEADLWGNLRWAKRKGAAEYLASVEAGARHADERSVRRSPRPTSSWWLWTTNWASYAARWRPARRACVRRNCVSKED